MELRKEAKVERSFKVHLGNEFKKAETLIVEAVSPGDFPAGCTPSPLPACIASGSWFRTLVRPWLSLWPLTLVFSSKPHRRLESRPS